jgi:putative ABC transport system ATP-binding protein
MLTPTLVQPLTPPIVTPPTYAIELLGVSKRYRIGEVSVTALDHITVQIQPGEFVVVLGPSGSGKTTLLNLIGALDTPTSGTIWLNGQPLKGDLFAFRRKTVSFIFQTFNLFPSLTARENVELGLQISDHADHISASAILESVGLGARLNHFPHQLSGGEQQRVAIARALATGNPLLLADEPTGELDFKTGVQILELLQQQTEVGRTVIVVTHNREISRVADRVIELSSGHIISDGAPVGGKALTSSLHW